MTYRHTTRTLLEVIPLLLVIIIPLSVHAGVFSSLMSSMLVEPAVAEIVYTNSYNAQNVPLLKAATHPDPNPAKGGGDVIVHNDALVPVGDLGEEEKVNSNTANGEISVYIVREGDTLSQIAEMFDVSANTILWANDISKASLIQPDDKLVILPITGVRHVVKDGDTISTIAKKYDGDVDDILGYNQLSSADEISVGDTVVIPGGAVSAPAPTRVAAAPVKTSGTTASGAGSSGFINPLPGSVKSQGIHGYNGVDLAAPSGSAIRAAAAGEVIVSKSSGWNGGYGQYIVIKHGNGTQTLYSHLSSNAVGVGARVAAGETIGGVGSTGQSTGNHLHFEVRGARNPF